VNDNNIMTRRRKWCDGLMDMALVNVIVVAFVVDRSSAFGVSSGTRE
jgi:hypothetical protein